MHYSSRDCDTRNAGRAASVAPLERDARLDPEPRAHVSRPDLAHELVVREVSVEPLVEVVVVLLVAPELHDLAELRRRDALAILELEAVVEQRELRAISCIHASFLSRHASEKVKIHIDSEVPQILNFGGKVEGFFVQKDEGLAVWGQRILEGPQYRDFYVCHRQYGQKFHVCHTPKNPLTRTPYCTDPSQKSRVFRDKRALKEKRKDVCHKR